MFPYRHRRNLIFKTGVDYDTHHPDTIDFIPPDGILTPYERDYEQMREQMIYGENTKDFKTIIERLRQLLQAFRQVK